MSLLHMRIAGYELDDGFVLKIIVGIICSILLLILIGQTGFSNWILESFAVWVGVTMIVVPITYFFIEEQLGVIGLMMIIIGVAVLLIFSAMGNIPGNILFIAVLQSIIWMTIFSIILEFFKENIKMTVRKRRK